jgi:hypothetical protein
LAINLDHVSLLTVGCSWFPCDGPVLSHKGTGDQCWEYPC